MTTSDFETSAATFATLLREKCRDFYTTIERFQTDLREVNASRLTFASALQAADTVMLAEQVLMHINRVLRFNTDPHKFVGAANDLVRAWETDLLGENVFQAEGPWTPNSSGVMANVRNVAEANGKRTARLIVINAMKEAGLTR